ncbi:MAG: amidase [Alphaproteobacteria bacterium]|jgi:amidase|nr:amidase [Alphaproteobacteria bacterium]
MSDLAFAGLVEVGRKIRDGELTSVAVTEAMFERIDRLDDTYHSYARLMRDSALADAARADAEIAAGTRRGPLHGVPVAVKDLCDTAGVVTACGIPMFNDRVPEKDATVVTRLRDAGAVILGKLQMTEGALAMHHPDIIPPVNPWVPGRWSGSSSSGSGVSVATGLAYGSLGSDTGGSIRFPALCDGVVGIKGTWGRVSRHGVFPLADTLDHIGPLTRSVEDAAAMLGAIAGRDEADPTSLTAPVPDYLADITSGVKGLKIGIDRKYCSDGVDPVITATVERGVAALADAGAEIVDITMPPTDEATRGWSIICICEAVVGHRETFPERSDEYSDVFQGLLEAGTRVPGPTYAAANIARRELVGGIDALHEQVDLIATIVVPDLIPTLADFVALGEDADGLARLVRYTSVADLTGNPTISLPAGFDTNGAPLGIQFMGRPLEESLLCRAGWVYQEACDWRGTRPEIAGD